MTPPLSPATPKRRRLANGNSAPSTPASPAMRVIGGLRSWLSPWRGNVKRSAAFGADGGDEEEEHQQDDEPSRDDALSPSSSPAQHNRGEEDMDQDRLLYPPLPSSTTMPSIGSLPETAVSRAQTSSKPFETPSATTPNGGTSYPFTFAAPSQADEVARNPFSGSHSPSYTQFTPRRTAFTPSQTKYQPHSPLSRNYDLLAKFFAQKAAEEAGDGDGAGSSSSVVAGENRLTDEEIRGCLRLIEESGRSEGQVRQVIFQAERAQSGAALDVASESGFEIPRRRATIRQSWLSPSPAYNSQSPHSALDAQAYSDRMSVSPEHPRRGQLNQAPSTSFLAPLGASMGTSSQFRLTSSTTEPAIFARSLIGQRPDGSSPSYAGSLSGASSGSRFTGSAASKRRRPLYLGPGMSSSRHQLHNRRSQAARDAASSNFARSQSTTIIGLGKRQRVESEWGADEFNQEGQNNFAPPSISLRESDPFPPHAGSIKPLPSTGSSASLFASTRPPVLPTRIDLHPQRAPPSPSSAAAITKEISDTPASSAIKSRTASAVLSILAQPDLPKPPKSSITTARESRASSSAPQLRRSKRGQSVDVEDGPASTSGGTSFRPDSILNPYQTASSLQLAPPRSTAAGSRSRTAEAVEKMKDERRRSSRLRKASTPDQNDSEGLSLLEKIERSKPASLTGGTRRRGGSASTFGSASVAPLANGTGNTLAPMEEEESSTRSRSESPSIAPFSTTPLSAPPVGRANISSSEDKTAEARRRLESLKNAQNSSQSQQQSPRASASPPATPSAVSFNKSHSHVPGRPSRLSIAFNANESPSSGSTADEEEVEASKERQLGDRALVGSNTSFGSGEPEKSSSQPGDLEIASKPSKAIPFTFGAPPQRSSEESAPSSSLAKAPAPFSFSQPASSMSAAAAPFTFQPAAASNHPSSSLNGASPFDARAEALRAPVSSLPRFDLSISVASTSTSPLIGHDELKKARAIALQDLPTFDLSPSNSGAGAQTNGAAPVTSKPITAQPSSGFHFALAPGTHGASAPSTNGTTTPTPAPTTRDTSVETSTGGNGGDAHGGGSGSGGDGDGVPAPTPSALLGSGQGEENEETLFEARAKFWKFQDSKWVDMGIGLAKIKQDSSSLSTSSSDVFTDADVGADGEGESKSPSSSKLKKKKRLLVRNIGNGAVNVNFRLFEGFRVTQTGNSLSFTGFQDGVGMPMRCKVKTVEGAREFKEGLEGVGTE